MKHKTYILSIIFCLIALPGFSGQVFESGLNQVALVELYTSEGCSSSPPGEIWMNNLKDKEGLWTEFIPLSFHVDYWNYLGWPDRFSSKDYSNRQRDYARNWRNPSGVYTPGLVLNGNEWRSWRRHQSVPDFKSKEVGELQLKEVTNHEFELKFKSVQNIYKKLNGNIALVGFDIKTKVSRGENRGRTLKHDFVVLDMNTQKTQQNSGEFVYRFKVDPESWSEIKKFAVVGWVSHTNSNEPIQVTGGYLS